MLPAPRSRNLTGFNRQCPVRDDQLHAFELQQITTSLSTVSGITGNPNDRGGWSLAVTSGKRIIGDAKTLPFARAASSQASEA